MSAHQSAATANRRAVAAREIKHDGFRVIARKHGAQAGNDLSDRFLLIVEALARLRPRSCIIEGEAVSCGYDGGSGRSHFGNISALFDAAIGTFDSRSFDLPRRVMRDVHRSVAAGASQRRCRLESAYRLSPAMNSCATCRLNSMLWKRCLAMAFIL